MTEPDPQSTPLQVKRVGLRAPTLTGMSTDASIASDAPTAMVVEENVFTDWGVWYTEDDGQALIINCLATLKKGADGRATDGEFIRLHSWRQGVEPFDTLDVEAVQRVHPELGSLIGKRVRVTVEVLGEDDGHP